MDQLALHGGTPVRSEILPYGRQWIDEEDIQAVIEVLRSDWLTTGPSVARFEEAFASLCQTPHAIAVSSGTAALHTAMFAAGAGEGDEVIVPTMTFAATANCALYQGASPVFADVDPATLLIDPDSVENLITNRTRAVITVDYTGHPCDYDRFRSICDQHDLILIDDASHSVGALYRGRPTGSLADLSTFSFHPVKHITGGEGGMITTDRDDYAEAMKKFRNHNIDSVFQQRAREGTWYYEVVDLGFNYRFTDIQSALASSQLTRLPAWLKRRREIAETYTEAFRELDAVHPLTVSPEVEHAWHLFVIRLDLDRLTVDRGEVFRALRAEGIGVNVHYIPVHLHPYYRERLGTAPGLCPIAEEAYERILSLPLYPKMSDRDIEDVVTAVAKVTAAFRR